MPDEIPPTPPAPAPAKPKQHHGTSNQLFINELKDSRKVAKSALDPRYAPGLADVELDPALPGQITTMADGITADLATMKAARTGRKTMSKQEKDARSALLAALAPIQSAAKRKYEGENETLRENYAIGEALASQSLQDVTVACQGILARLVPGPNATPPLDTLPGIKPGGQIAALSTAIDTYGAKDTAQGSEQNKASGLLEQIKTDIAILAGLRRKVQLAADQAWPWRTKSVATIRKAFLLPKDRPLTD